MPKSRRAPSGGPNVPPQVKALELQNEPPWIFVPSSQERERNHSINDEPVKPLRSQFDVVLHIEVKRIQC
ncbi:hypothetical protein NDU88_008932 [Pleurodeles waltl]|uniref:Uncharacterized protein n=1 Tax=Pleurodeles waltl TaxID=8319 RepID=A0AAV7P2D5_PLEWA|nr:hypothetical protein NDU88_008932 [Pleurodeles waltl]